MLQDERPGREVRAIPPLTLYAVEALYEQFATMLRGAVDMSAYRGQRYTSLECLKKVSDVVWEACPRTVYKDRVHLQSLYTLLAGLYIASFDQLAMNVEDGFRNNVLIVELNFLT